MALSEEHQKIVDQHTEKLGYRPGVFTAGPTLVLVRAANDQEFRRYQKKQTAALMAAAPGPKKRADAPLLFDAQRELAMCCIILPDKVAAAALLEQKPALVPRISDKATELAGEDIEEHEGN